MTNDVTVAESPRPGLLRRAVARASTSVRGLWFAHSSGYFGAKDYAWRHAFAYLRRRAVVITGTEAAGRSPADFRKALGSFGWSYAHLSGAALGECYGSWDPSVVELADKPWAHKLTDLTWVRDSEHGGKTAAKVHALVVPLRSARSWDHGRTWILVVIHMPLDNTEARARAWVDCCRGLVELQADLERRYPNGEVVIVADWNKNLREHDEAGQVRQNLEKPLRMVTSWALGLPRSGGTHGRQVIDYALLRRPLLAACQLLRDLPDSDHRAFRYRIRTSHRPKEAA